jgi:hypothetical protein
MSLPSELESLRNEKLTVEFSFDGKIISDNLCLIDWDKMARAQDEATLNDLADVQEYFMNDQLIDKVFAKEYLPFALLGLNHNPGSFQESSNGGMLLLKTKSQSDRSQQVFWFHDDDLKSINLTLKELKISKYDEPESDSTDTSNSNKLEESPFREIWQQTISLSIANKDDEAIVMLKDLAEKLPESAEVQLALAQMYTKKKDWVKAHEAITFAITNELFEAKYLIAEAILYLHQENWSKALQLAEDSFNLADEANRIIYAQFLGVMGVARSKLGQPELAAENLKKAKELFSMIGSKIPFFREELGKIKS